MLFIFSEKIFLSANTQGNILQTVAVEVNLEQKEGMDAIKTGVRANGRKLSQMLPDYLFL